VSTSVTPAAEGRVFFPNLDALRFLAFLIVFIGHAFAEYRHMWLNASPVVKSLGILIFDSAQLGVSSFFVLSGFLITYLILTEISASGRLDVIAFYVRRLLRIWPLYYALLFYAFVVHPLVERRIGIPAHAYPYWPYYVLFLSNFDILRALPFHPLMTNVTWSVAVEEQFYLTWPLLFRVVPRRYYAAIFLTVIAASAIFRAAHSMEGGRSYQVSHTLGVISDMGVGGLCAYLAWKSPRFQAWFARRRRMEIAIFYVAGAAVLALNHFLIAGGLAAVGRLAIAGVFAIIILEQNYSERSILKVSRLRFASAMGRYAYGLYLFHAVALWWVKLFYFRIRVNTKQIPFVLLVPLTAFIVTAVAAIISYHLYERPFLKLKERFAHVKNANC
jgi:peptidoglycan/LPS O-acetylase OafA/YrhL